MAKVIDIIKSSDKFSYSFEITPEVNVEDISNLDVEPAFFSVTWHAKSHQCKDYNIPPLNIVSYLRARDKQVLMHLSCDLLKKNYLDGLLSWLMDKGVRSLFVILGESVIIKNLGVVKRFCGHQISSKFIEYLMVGLSESNFNRDVTGREFEAVGTFSFISLFTETYDSSSSDFKTSLELLRYIKDKTGKYFCIGIAGFPDCNEDKLLQIKEKVDGGADFIVTQAFYDPNIYTSFLKTCQDVGINVPVIPGVFYFETMKQLTGFINMCKIKVSDDLLKSVNNKGLQKPGVEIVGNLVNSIRSEFPSMNFHFFTLNKLNIISNFVKQLQ